MTMPTFFIYYFVAGFVFASIFTIFNRYICKLMAVDMKVDSELFIQYILFWPFAIFIITLCGIVDLLKGSFTNYINYLSNILGDKK